MTPNEYQQLAARTLLGADRQPKITPSEQALLWNALGAAGETGEIAEHVKKGVLHRHGIDQGKLVIEIGDACWYLAALCTLLGVEFEEALRINIEKLKQRYPNGYNDSDSRVRVDMRGERNE